MRSVYLAFQWLTRVQTGLGELRWVDGLCVSQTLSLKYSVLK